MDTERSAAAFAPGTTTGPVAVTVVVSTRNRRQKIEACARVLAALRCRLPWQCVIVDNGSSDGTPERLRELATVLAPALEILSEPRAGVSRGRNAGIRAARGEFITMIDDDCLPESDFLDAVLEVFADLATGYYGGRVLLHDPADYPVTIKTSMQREDFPPGTVLRAGAIHGANFGFRRAVLERIGGFDPTLGPGTRTLAAEDIELATRASLAGWRGAYDPRPTVRHDHGRRTPDSIHSLDRSYDIGRGAYYLRAALLDGAGTLAFRLWWWNIWLKGYRGIRRFSREVLGALYWLGAQARRRAPEPLFPAPPEHAAMEAPVSASDPLSEDSSPSP
jgi:GT2 family glycosyltransferase